METTIRRSDKNRRQRTHVKVVNRKVIANDMCTVHRAERSKPITKQPHSTPGHVNLRTVKVAALVQNIDTGFYSAELEFIDVNGSAASALVARSDLENTSSLLKLLADLGARIPESEKLVLRELKEIEPGLRRRITGRSGWHGDDTFVMPRNTIGSDQALKFHTQMESWRGEKAGSLTDWKIGLRDACAASSYLSFGLALSFAAPIAALIRVEETACFHFFGESGGGKTLMGKVTESVIGRATEKDLVSANTSDPGLNDLMASCNATVMVLNELKTAGVRGDVGKLLTRLAHTLTSGSGYNRSKFAQRQPELALQRWCIFGLTSMEQSLEGLSQGNRDMGERARFIDIPVPAVADGGVFDRTGLRGERRMSQTRFLAEAAETTIVENYGVPFALFIAKVAEHRDRVIRAFERDVERFVDRAAPQGDSWEQRFARKFGYAYAGGRQAIRAGVFPGTTRELRRSCTALYRRSRASLAAANQTTSTTISRLVAAVADDQMFPRIELGQSAPPSFKACAGFRRNFRNHGDCVCLRSSALKRLVGSDAGYKAAIASLKEAEAIIQGRGDDLTHILLVKGGSRSRYIVLRSQVFSQIEEKARS